MYKKGLAWAGKSLLVFCLLCVPVLLVGQISLKGKVVDGQNAGIAYVSIGIAGTEVAKLSSFEGEFAITIPAEEAKERLTFHVPGFKTRSFPIDSLKSHDFLTVTLFEQVRQLGTVEVVNKEKLKTRLKGNKGPVIGALETSLFTQRAYGIVTKVPADGATLESVQVHVTNDSTITFVVRPFVYPVIDGEIDQTQSLVPENRHYTFTMKKGWLTMDLSDLHIETSGRIAFGIEWLEVAGAKDIPMASISLTAIGRNSIESYSFQNLQLYRGIGAFAVKGKFQYFD